MPTSTKRKPIEITSAVKDLNMPDEKPDVEYTDYDRSRLGGRDVLTGTQPRYEPAAKESFHIETYDEVAAIHIFSDKVVVIGKTGNVMLIDRFNGQLRVA